MLGSLKKLGTKSATDTASGAAGDAAGNLAENAGLDADQAEAVGNLAEGGAGHVIENQGIDGEEAKGQLTSVAVSQGLGAAGVENEHVGAAVESGVTSAVQDGANPYEAMNAAAQGGVESFAGQEEVKGI